MRKDPGLVDRILSLNAVEREQALAALTGVVMDQVRSASNSRQFPRVYFLPHNIHEALVSEFEEETREAARFAAGSETRNLSDLAQLRSPFLERILLEGLGAEEPGRRAFAADACGGLGIAAAETRMPALLKDSDRRVIVQAIGALGNLRAGRHAPALLTFLKHEDPAFRRIAAEAAQVPSPPRPGRA